MAIGIIEILCGLFLILAAAYSYYYYNAVRLFNFWKDRGIPGPTPLPFYGNLKLLVLGQISVGDLVRKIYNEYKHEPIFGIFAGKRPILIVNDPELIQDVMIKQFSVFADRGIRLFEKVEPLSANLINLEVERWRPLRAMQMSMFSYGKLKELFFLLLQGVELLEPILERMIGEEAVVEVCEISARFTTDVIGLYGFGIDMHALKDENCEFRKLGRAFIHADKWKAFKVRFKQFAPWLYTFLWPIMRDSSIIDFFMNCVKETIAVRKKNNFRRGDFIDWIIEMKGHPEKLEGIKVTDELLIAQAFSFFTSGFDTSSETMSHALYELALNQPVQDKLRGEILDELAKNDGKLKFDLLKRMPYLEKVFSETLRKYPVTTVIPRKCSEDYTFHEKQLTLPKDSSIWIPVYGIHWDPNIFPDPEKFDPERFDETLISKRHLSYYMPFGIGPRNCIGARFGPVQTKVGLISILRKYKVEVCDRTPIPYVSNTRRFLLGPAAGIHLRFTKLK